MSELYPELMRGSSQGEFVMQYNRAHKHTEKSQTKVTSFLSLHTVLLPVSTQTDIDAAVSIFWCQVLSCGINIFSTETANCMLSLFTYCFGIEIINFLFYCHKVKLAFFFS